MKVSKKSDYALRALVTLAENYGSHLSIRVLSQENDIPKRFLEQIMLDLKNAHFVEGIPGRDGGYILSKPPSEISVGNLIRFFDGMIAPIGCVSQLHYESCSQEKKCKFRRIFLEIRNYSARLMDKLTLADLIKFSPVTEMEVLDSQYNLGGGI